MHKLKALSLSILLHRWIHSARVGGCDIFTDLEILVASTFLKTGLVCAGSFMGYPPRIKYMGQSDCIAILVVCPGWEQANSLFYSLSQAEQMTRL
jgi:hypothetical protein